MLILSVITTDLLARGMDIKGVENVISYDSATTARGYVHRAGRTARAGREGSVWSLVTRKEGRWFWNNVIGDIQRASKVERITISEDRIPESTKDKYHSIIET